MPDTKQETSHEDSPQATEYSDLKGSSLTIIMPLENKAVADYMQYYVRSELMQRYGITLKISGGQPTSILRLLQSGQGGKPGKTIDLFWLNDETLLQFIAADVLEGPFLNDLTNTPLLKQPFPNSYRQEALKGMLMPWGLEQFTFYYNAAKVKDFPSNPEALKTYIKAHPGRFSFPISSLGYDFLETLLINLSSSANIDLTGSFSAEKYQQGSQLLQAYITEIRPFLWKKGAEFPTETQLHTLFLAGELDFSMGAFPGFLDFQIKKERFPKTAKIGTWENGSLQKAHYIAIAKQVGHKKAAVAFCNFLISPEAQLQKANPMHWGEETILTIDKLTSQQQGDFQQYQPQTSNKPLPALAPEYRLRLMQDLKLWIR